MEERKVMVQVRLPETLVKDIDHLAVDWGVFRAEAFERLLREALKVHKEQGSLWLATP